MNPIPAGFHRRTVASFAFALFAIFLSTIAFAQTPSFPGAAGFGSIATGGRNGTVYHVTTLADSGPGSFRDAVSSGNRTIVFDVGGYITLNSAVSCQGNLTIAGQTAPGSGIGFKGGEISFAGRGNIIMRYIRIRPGSDTASDTDDALSLYQAKNAIFDHCSIEFAPWNNIDGVGDSSHVITNITFQNCIIADPTYDASSPPPQGFGCHSESVGGTWSWFNNIFANSHNRNPLAKVDTVFINNAEYNCSAGYTTHTSTHFKHDIVNNYFVAGPASGGNFPWYQIDNNQSMYFTGNLYDSDKNSTLNGSTTVPLPGYQGGGTILGTPWSSVTTGVSIMSTPLAWRYDLSLAGTLPRDEIDSLIVSQMKTLGNGAAGTGAGTAGPTGGLYSSQTQTGLGNNGYGTVEGGATPTDSDADGMPDYWELAAGSNPYSANSLTNTSDGYTLLEHYLNFLAVLHVVTQTNATVDVDLSQYTAGFSGSAVYAVTGASNGVVTLTGSTAHFAPSTSFAGIGRFDFTVNDGVAFTNTIMVLVTPMTTPQDLIWVGDGSGNVWNTTNTLWSNGTNATTFHSGDTVTFDDTGSDAPFINIIGTVAPASVTISANQDYAFGGSGTVSGTGLLTKSGAGSLTISNANTFTGGVDMQGGTLNIGNGGSIGSGQLTLENATLNSLYNESSTLTLSGGVNVPAADISSLNMSGRTTLTGLSGGGTLNLTVAGTFNVGSATGYNYFNGAFANFTGTLNATGTVAGGMITANFNGGAFDGNLGNAAVNLSNVGIIARHNSGGNTLRIGALSGDATSTYAGGGYAGGDICLVGGLNLDTIFAGVITNTVNTNRFCKVGTGTLTLSGNSIFSGATFVSNGTLCVNGSIDGNVVTVTSGGKLSGTGALNGGVSINSGGTISPGSGNNSAGTLTVGNGLSLATATLNFDLSSSPSAGNDKILMSSGSLTLNGTQTFNFNLTDGSLGNGTYDLIDGATYNTASGVGFVNNLPSGGRQTYSMQRAASGSSIGYVWLVVSGTPSANLIWQGTNGSSWDSSTTNWLNGSVADKFYNADSVRFDDTSANGTVTLAGTLQPGLLLVSNNVLDYAFGGSGAWTGSSPLIKSGSGSLSINTTNSAYSGTVNLAGGTTFLGNANSLGSGIINFSNGATMDLAGSLMYPGNTINVPAGESGTINSSGGVGNGLGGNLVGAVNSTLNISSGVSFNSTSSTQFDNFAGTIDILPGGTLRFSPNSSGNTYGSLAPTFVIDGTLRPRNAGNTVQLGALSGSGSLAGPQSNAGTGDTLYVIGGNNSDASFSGNISSNSAVAASQVIVNKIGLGTLTLGGASTYTGGTTVSAGTLRVTNPTGSATGTGGLDVQFGATLAGNGIIGSDTTVDDLATLAPGNPTGTLTFSSDLTLGDNSSVQFTLGSSSDSIVVNGTLFLTGKLSVTNGPGFGPGTYPLFTCTGTLIFDQFTLAFAPGGYNYSFDTNTPGIVKLIVSQTVPNIGNVSSANGKFILNASGATNGTFYLLGSTNLATPVADWTRVLTNQFDDNGQINLTNTVDPNAPQYFYLLQTP
ncbi:MAG TPA: autotransporter-associated beta strand repeat-containing protein [Verrucomicrobiae bacterium]|nr:autotransporter-associated beta strand repeat-containing protein [Verrucomicrobiae bacterium]